ncbi:LPD38 domain-containing protein [Photobacterium kishitanii]|uniref:LPD38 domain-containing protein n=1 Tax=Photobacterium kishitanii TaxID=318456 RepID=UPI000D1624E4|nr:LPD38 domain-containing protein [Photobacterium kishitanii]PSU23804.1 hypothetical protein CTM84_02545 [Photobacterium kishitanii]
MSERLLGNDIDPKATVQAQTDMTNTGGDYELPEGFSLANFQPREVKNHEVSLLDGAKSFVSGGLRSLEGASEAQRQVLNVLNDKANANDGWISSVASAAQDIPLVRAAIATTPYMKNVLDSAANTVEDSLSDDAKAAASEPLAWREGDNWRVSTDPAVWGIQFSKSMGYMLPTIATAFSTGGVSASALLPNITNAMIRSGASATLASKAAPIALNMLMKAPAVGVGMSTDLGTQGVESSNGVIDAEHRQLMESQHYQDAFIDIDSDPKYVHLSDGEKFGLAKEFVSNQASRAAMTDVRNVAASAAATMVGDIPLVNAMLKGFKHGGGVRGTAAGIAKGIAREAPMEAIQEGTQQRVSNEVSNEYQGSNIDPNQGVAEAAVSGGLMGAAMGGSMGSIGGFRSKSQVDPITEISVDDSPVSEAPIDSNAVDASISEDSVSEQHNKIYPNDFENTSSQIRQQEADINETASELETENVVESTPDSDVNPDINPELATSIFNEVDTQNDLDIPAYLRQPVKLSEKAASIDESLPAATNTDLVVSDSRPDVIYGHDKRTTQDPTIYDKPVGEPQFEGGIPKNKLRQLKYLANRRNAKIPLALQPLKGSGRFTRPEYRSRLVSIADEAISVGNSKSVNVQVDSISDAITKLGGVSRTSAQADGIDSAAFKRNKLFPATKGRTFDELAEVLNEHGYRARDGGKLDANAVLDLVDGEVNNNERHFSSQSDMLTETDHGSAFNELVREYGAERVKTAISKALQGNRLGDRQAEIVNEAMDVIETGRIEQAGGIEARHGERDSRREARALRQKKQLEKTHNELGLPKKVESDNSVNIEREYNETVEAVLDNSIKQATIANPIETESLIYRYETGQITTADLISRLGELDYADKQKLNSMEDTQSTSKRKDPTSVEERARERETPSPKESESTRINSDRVGTDDVKKPKHEQRREPKSKITSTDDHRSMLYSQQALSSSNTTTKGIPLKQAELAVKSWLRQYNGGAGVSVNVVKTQAEAEQILGTSFNDYKVNAFYDEVTASVVVVADNIANTKDLRQKLRHEILVHHGLRAVVGDTEYGRILKTVYSGLGSKHLKSMVAELEQSYSRENLNNFVEEVLAHVAENERNKSQQWYDRVMAVIATALRKVGLMSASDITKAELHNIVQTLTDRIKSVNEWGPDSSPPGNDSNGHLSRTKFSRTVFTNNQSSSAFLDAVEKARSHIKGPASDVAAGGFDIPTENIKSTIVRNLADKFQVLKELQRNIVKADGKITEDSDTYLAEELFHGKAENDLRIMKDAFVKPLANKMAQYDISQTKLDEYLIARHAQERNDHIASINAKFPDGGSGMSNADAQSKLDEIRNSSKQKHYDELAHIVDAMIARQRDVLRDSGLESDAVIDSWQSHYKHYVPLKGIAKDESSLPRTGKGFSIGGKEAKNAMGRKSIAESPSSHAISDLTEKLIRARKNEVGNALLKLVKDNPSDDYWQVFSSDKPDTSPQIIERKNSKTGQKEKVVEDRPVPMSMMPDYYFPTKKDGKVYYIKLHDKRLMKAMKNIGPDNSNGIIRAMATFNRFLASVNTSYNPEFVVGNFARDIQTAFLNLSAEQTRDDGKIKGKNIAKQVIVDIKHAMPAVYASLNDKSSKTPSGREWQNYFNEFMEDGGKTGWFDMKDVDGQAKDIERMVAVASGSTKGKAYKAFDAVAGFVENVNSAVENAVRLSAYVNARKAGISRKKSASLAKNMTVNFNRRGEVGTTLNAMYMFANASIQGTVNFVRTMADLNGDGKLKWKNMNKAQKLATGIVAGSFALAFANRNAAGDDDDGENWYDKVPDYVKERNFVIMKSLVGGKQDGSYWSIPMPYGYNVFSVLGSSVESVMNSDSVTPVKAAGDLVMAALGAFSPIGMSESHTITGAVLKNALPTIGKPFAELGLNENFFGGQIYKENMPFGTPQPNSSISKRGTSDHYKDFAKWLNQVSGGSKYRSGGLDFSPDAMQYIVGYMGGAAFRFTSVKVPGLVDKVTNDNVEDSQVAFLSRISGRVMPYADQSKFYERRDELLQIRDESKVTFGTKRKNFLGTYGKKLRLLPMLKVTENQLKALRKRRNAIYALNIPSKDKDLRLKNIERQMKTVIDRFNRQYNA